jgi:serine/threonine protein kinase
MRSDDASFEMFGNYLLLDRIACGGMAAIFLARPALSSANGRILIIKRILPQVAGDPEFVKMFRSEIQVCMGFNHPNIVQLFDFGQIESQPYIAMEYIEGKSIRQIISQFARRNQAVPIGLAVSIAAQAAAGLHYAHTFRNRVTGEPLNVIHRDISPQNILMSYEGNVKLIDFGIAKAEIENIDQTRTGSIKGKVCYLSPEQALRHELTGRSDVFSLGAVLWEMLTGQKLFTLLGRDDLEVMAMIRNCEKFIRPPSAVNPKVPKDLDEIVLKSLAKNPQDRYESAEEFQKALRKFILRYFPGFGYTDVAKVVKAAFQDELTQERTRIRELNAQAQTLLSHGQTTQPSIPSDSAPYIPKFISSGTNPAIPLMAPTQLLPAPERKSFVTRTRVLFGLLYLSTIWFLKVDQEYLFFERFFIPADAVRMASIQPQEAQAQESQATTEEDAQAQVQPEEKTAKEVFLKININPATSLLSTRITVNGRDVNPKAPMVKVPMDRKIQVKVERRAFGVYRNEFVLDSSKNVNHAKVFNLSVKLQPRAKR